MFVGEVEHHQKNKLLRQAKALLSPIRWDEPFGLTNIEAMACGTPVIGIRRGSMSEIIVNGKTGFLCNNVNEMVCRVKDLPKIDRQACRDHVAKNFSAQLMAQNYLKTYQQVIKDFIR